MLKYEKSFFRGIILNIGNVKIEGKAILAPMAGVADMAFRELCKEYGAALTVGEMVSSKGITMTDRKSRELLMLSDRERPAAVQIFGYDADIMAESVKSVLEFKPDIIDINMGCPAPKIVNNKSGSSLLRYPDLAESIMKAVVNASSVPVTVKMRSGWDSDSKTAVEIAKRAEQAGIAAVTVHGRTREQMYALPIDFDIIRQVRDAVKIPVIGNGDITDGISAAKMIELTDCDAVMVGRGALGRPWVFSQINAYLNYGTVIPEPPVSERMRVMLKHIERICEYKGERVGIREARKHAAWYTKGIRGTARYKREICAIENLEQLREIAYRIAVENQ
jgi:nifR3 family TIM-barrel protein